MCVLSEMCRYISVLMCHGTCVCLCIVTLHCRYLYRSLELPPSPSVAQSTLTEAASDFIVLLSQ